MIQKKVGILGGGQLGQMLADAALPLGISCTFLEDAPDCPASFLGQVYATTELENFAQVADVFTLEFENTPLAAAQWLEATYNLSPCAEALAVAQDRLQEKHTFTQLGIATVPFLAVHELSELQQAAEQLGLPLVLKTSQGGYDGKGQVVIKSAQDIDTAWQALGKQAPLIAEGFIHFEREVSIIAVRSQAGDIRYYDLVENHHHQGILAKTVAPAPQQTVKLVAQAQAAIKTLLEHFSYVGVMALELFVTADGVLANEIAPRVHNSGHHTIEACVTSQFENHMRAVAGLPLGSTALVNPAVMVNLIGEHPAIEDILAIDGAHLHLYAKQERPERKLGHVTLIPVGDVPLESQVARLVEVLPNKLGLGHVLNLNDKC